MRSYPLSVVTVLILPLYFFSDLQLLKKYSESRYLKQLFCEIASITQSISKSASMCHINIEETSEGFTSICHEMVKYNGAFHFSARIG